ncbi:hypothetical protein WQ54_07590 [Bacillus sp. SA1-12]|uniref:hypothetical protein n=1 Tax=Bacillus sp. SA1-12 TaxID=1455638 RepID=UPI000625493F|nr:hypothetical protein [Bacillus sp. SA1-12]KKI92740.1 hypothetical protein WQ54_07590 [Bacillus sp. SA1-12]
MTSYKKWLIVCFIAVLLCSFNNGIVQAKEENPKDKIVKLKDGETLNVADPELQKRQDEVWEQLVKTDFSNKVDQKLKENGYKRYTHTGEFNINYQIVDIKVDQKPDESKIETIENISRIVSEIAKENKVVPTITRVTFHKQ